MKRILFLFLLGSITYFSFAEAFDLARAKDIFAHGKEHIAEQVRYPLQREYPLPVIKNKTEFLQHIASLIDDELIAQIYASTEDDWFTGSWRGSGFLGGVVWLDVDYTIYRINYKTKQYIKDFEAAVEKDKSSLRKEYRHFSRPVEKWDRHGKLYQIDATDSKGYRLLIIDTKTQKAEIALYHGSENPDGTIGNHYYIWEYRDMIHFIYSGGPELSFYSVVKAEQYDFDRMEDLPCSITLSSNRATSSKSYR